MVHARMGPGEENSGKLVSVVRKKAAELARLQDTKWILTDGPPGIGCATIASVTGADAVLVVMEPSLTSLHDARRVIELVNGFKIPIFSVINKADIEPDMAGRMEQFLVDSGVPLLGKIPFDQGMLEAMVQGRTVVESTPESEISDTFRAIWAGLTEAVG
jgi:MinD superfamily P-loop ATPase